MRPVYFFNPSYDERNINFQNLGLVSIASHLKRKGIPAYVYMNYLDPRVTKEKDYDIVLPQVLKENPKYIGISCMTTQYMKALDLTKRIKELSPDTMVIWGGHHVKPSFKELWDNSLIDFRVVGWGELESEWVYRRNNIFKGDARDNALEMSVFDYPLDFSTVINYQPVERLIKGVMSKQASIMTSYGCPYSCRFCINAVQDKHVIYRDMKAVTTEVKQVLNMGATSVAFYDELFFIKKDRMTELMNGIEGLSFPWLALSRIDTCPSPRELSFYKSHGCAEIHFGVESGSQRVLDKCINKKIKAINVIPVLQRVLDADILPRASFIFGMPGETIDDVSQTIHLIMEMAERFGNRFVINAFFFYPIPGTPMTDEAFRDLSVQDCIDAARLSVHPYKLFDHFSKKGFYDWLPDKKFFAECWYIARIISEICAPYKYYEGYNPHFEEWGMSVSKETYNKLDTSDLAKKWLDKVVNF